MAQFDEVLTSHVCTQCGCVCTVCVCVFDLPDLSCDWLRVADPREAETVRAPESYTCPPQRRLFG